MACALFTLITAATAAPASPGGAAVLRALTLPDTVVMIRHANAPGFGDPQGMTLASCASQRNLDAAGRAQATRIGEALRRAGLRSAQVYSSPWCRCRETAERLGLGPVTILPALGSFFQDSARGPTQTAELGSWLAAADAAQPIVLVTHQVNITALTGIVPASGEAVVLSRGGGELKVIGRWTAP